MKRLVTATVVVLMISGFVVGDDVVIVTTEESSMASDTLHPTGGGSLFRPKGAASNPISAVDCNRG